MEYAELLAKFFELFWNKVCAWFWKYFTGQPVIWKDNLVCFIPVVCTEPLHPFVIWELAMILYITKIMLVINCKDVSSYRTHYFPGIVHDFILPFWLYCLKVKVCEAIFIASSMSAFILTQYMESHASSLPSLCPCDLGVAVKLLFLAVRLVVLPFYLSWQFHVWLQSHVWMISTVAVPSVPQLLSVAICRVLVLPGYLSAHHIMLLSLFLLLPCSLVGMCTILLCWSWDTCLLFPHLSLFHG